MAYIRNLGKSTVKIKFKCETNSRHSFEYTCVIYYEGDQKITISRKL